jgi:hypothetical protein
MYAVLEHCSREPTTNHITANMRVLKPDLQDPIITTDFLSPGCRWQATVWGDENNVILATVDDADTVVDAMRILLRLTSAKVGIKVQEWKNVNADRAVYRCGGVKYI